MLREDTVTIIGAGLAGCSLAWDLHFRGHPFVLREDQPERASSLAAAGMLAPITGKALNPSWRISEYHEDALAFYARVESELETKLWYSYPVVRPFFDAKDRRKFERKCEAKPAVAHWVDSIEDDLSHVHADAGALVQKGSGRLYVKKFVQETRAYFGSRGLYQEGPIPLCSTPVIYSGGARSLIEQNPIKLSHRCAKGEILTIKAPDLPQDRILSRGTWIVPTGYEDGTFLAGANYEWDDLTNTPTAAGKEKVLAGISRLINVPFEVISHVAGVRPIIRQSEPVIGSLESDQYYMNGLGSKGVLYAPKVAHTLLNHILLDHPIPQELSLAELPTTGL